jgi:hypothetical protein
MTMAPLYERLAPRLPWDCCRHLLVDYLLVAFIRVLHAQTALLVSAPITARSLILVDRAMNRPPATMPGPYSGGVDDGAPFALSGEVVRGRGAGGHKSTLAAMLHGLEALRHAGRKSQVHG